MSIGPLQELAHLKRWCTWLPENKAPRTPKGYAKTNDPGTWGTLEQVSKHGLVGVMTGDLGDGSALIALDFDAHKDKATKTVIRAAYSDEGWADEFAEVVETLTSLLGPLPIERSPSRSGAHAFLIIEGVPDGVKHREVIKIEPFELEVLGGQFCTITSEWITTEALPRVAWKDFEQAMRAITPQTPDSTPDSHREDRPKVEYPPIDARELREALDGIDPARLSRDDWRDVGMALKHEGAPCAAWDRWSQRDSARYEDGECARQWDSFTGAGITGATIFHLAREQGWSSTPRVREWTGPDLAEGDTPQDLRLWFSAPNQALVADYVLEQHATDESLVYDQGAFWQWVHPRWEQLGGEKPGDQLAATLHDWQRNNRMWIEPTEKHPKGRAFLLSTAQQDSIIRHCRIPVQRPDFFDQAPTGIAFKDVFVRVAGQKLVTESITPDHRQRHAYAFDYDPEATCPETDQRLREILEGFNDADTEDRVRLLWQFWGAAILGMGPRFLKALVLHGKKGSGKSTIGELVCATMPPGSVDAIEPQDFGDDKKAVTFMRIRLNYLAEVKHERPISNHTIVKTIIGGEYITARDVYRSAVTFRPRASHLWCANRVPQIPGVDGSWWDRIMVLGIKDHQYRGATGEIHRLAKALVKKELPGIIRRAIDGARDLLECRRYAVPLSSVRALESWTHQADSVALWLDEATMMQPADVAAMHWPRPTEVHDHFLRWARSRHHQQMSHHELMERIVSRGVQKTNSRGARIGLMLRHVQDWTAGEPSEDFPPF